MTFKVGDRVRLTEAACGLPAETLVMIDGLHFEIHADEWADGSAIVPASKLALVEPEKEAELAQAEQANLPPDLSADMAAIREEVRRLQRATYSTPDELQTGIAAGLHRIFDLTLPADYRSKA